MDSWDFAYGIGWWPPDVEHAEDYQEWYSGPPDEMYVCWPLLLLELLLVGFLTLRAYVKAWYFEREQEAEAKRNAAMCIHEHR
jgi:hypothetical protein